MTLRVSVRETYLQNELVQFSASVDPGGLAALLPSAKPYKITRDGNVVHQPAVQKRRQQLKPGGGILSFEWDQSDPFGKKVPVGEYRLDFIALNFGEHSRDFAISSNWLETLKGGAKWISRALAASAACSAFFAPITGAGLGLAAVGAQALADDPPDPSYLLIAQVESVFDRLKNRSLDVQETTSSWKAILRFYDFARSIRETIERIQGAELARDDGMVAAQTRHLRELCHQAATWLPEFEAALYKIGESMPSNFEVKRDSATSKLSSIMENNKELIFVDFADAGIRKTLTKEIIDGVKSSILETSGAPGQIFESAVLEVKRYGRLLTTISSSPESGLIAA